MTTFIATVLARRPMPSRDALTPRPAAPGVQAVATMRDLVMTG
ncbi:hypothetical protein OHT61_00795 [Streptomyces sp. NBC_00178]|nr:hypothetical protein [Streptomyces sp. NBC_00178]